MAVMFFTRGLENLDLNKKKKVICAYTQLARKCNPRSIQPFFFHVLIAFGTPKLPVPLLNGEYAFLLFQHPFLYMQSSASYG